MLTAEQQRELLIKLAESIIGLGIQFLMAILILLIGLWVAKFIQNLSKHLMIKAQLEPTLIRFFVNLIYIAIVTFVSLAALGQLGIKTTSFIAVLGAAGLAIGLALQGSLSNFASGVFMIVFRPFKVHDYIEGGGVEGIVEEIQIFTTLLKTPDNKTIIIPNSKLYGDKIVNHSIQPIRRVDIKLNLSYNTDLDQVRELFTNLVQTDPRVLLEPIPDMEIQEIAAGGIKTLLTVWVINSDYFRVRSDLNQSLKQMLDGSEIQLV
ncbi:mechanosensitive ion channel family protein [Planktothrix agardhii]|jgi:small conductance mechanosensitive channel|uniref:MscS n=2 Tax=Planktothrix agardhii TaxID=1160 RepID=A0A073CEB1_PLAA1|nr:mechanosensitive ion channel domain-containing protein [Planktothrix agardhii]MCF3607598.1 mechanosensitive ion channel [Planktothrix agardhii 1033]KEI66471.1 MscS [Planktothrix agardhii NIVA-CYA 126/8]MCB8760699.1 mechanosensitive ion channel [Planktothrix agardhii 1813]MCB8762515.1 mechanosensitive ion channel [Planktothrix agardhii 1809]MCB8763491.1 mechanosensitive ion channel [Planktothrix agardhii 1809]